MSFSFLVSPKDGGLGAIELSLSTSKDKSRGETTCIHPSLVSTTGVMNTGEKKVNTCMHLSSVDPIGGFLCVWCIPSLS